MVSVRLLAKIHKTQIAQKISRFRSTLLYLSSQYRNLRHTIPLTISPWYQTFSREFSQFIYLISQCNLTLIKRTLTELIYHTNRFKQKQISFSIQLSFNNSIIQNIQNQKMIKFELLVRYFYLRSHTFFQLFYTSNTFILQIFLNCILGWQRKKCAIRQVGPFVTFSRQIMLN